MGSRMSQEAPVINTPAVGAPVIGAPDLHTNTPGRTTLYGSALSIRCRSYTILQIKRMTHDYLPDFCFLIVFDLIGHNGKHYNHVIWLKSNLIYCEVRIRRLSPSNEPISTYRRYRVMMPEVHTSNEHLYEWEDRGECNMSNIIRL